MKTKETIIQERFGDPLKTQKLTCETCGKMPNVLGEGCPTGHMSTRMNEWGWDDVFAAAKTPKSNIPNVWPDCEECGGSGYTYGDGSEEACWLCRQKTASAKKAAARDAYRSSDYDKEGNPVNEKAPPGGEKVVKALKKQKGVDNPFAVAWSMKNKGEI